MNKPEPATNLTELQRQVGEWSQHNFGDQLSKTEGYDATIYTIASLNDTRSRTIKLPVYLGSLAPLMGMFEEVGELGLARNDPDIQDALSDIVIYACDYAEREGLALDGITLVGGDVPEYFIPKKDIKQSSTLAYDSLFTCSLFQQMTGKLGLLYRITLKRHQGIRGFDVRSKYQEAREQYLWEFSQAVANFSQTFYGLSPLYFALKEWNEKVSKRDWVTDPSGRTHHPEEMKENESS